MTTTLVTMPQLGETVTEGTIVRWYKQPGDGVAVDETLFDVSTDKVDAEVPSAVEGVLREIRVGDGEVAPVGTLLGLITTTADEPVTFDEPEADTGAHSGPPPEPVVAPREEPRRRAGAHGVHRGRAGGAVAGGAVAPRGARARRGGA